MLSECFEQHKSTSETECDAKDRCDTIHAHSFRYLQVDVSADGGKTWFEADLVEQERDSHFFRTWSWTIWEVRAFSGS